MNLTLDGENSSSAPEETICSIAQDGIKQKDIKDAHITLLDGHKKIFQIGKKSNGELLFELVAQNIGLIETDYFDLAFYDDNLETWRWLRSKKKISKQLKKLPWDFMLRVKLYVSDPRQLNLNNTRHLFALQLRMDLYEEKLSASFTDQAMLGSLIAQIDLGDYNPKCQYFDALVGLNIVKEMDEELAEKIIFFYEDHKGKRRTDAELEFLNVCRDVEMYGTFTFHVKEQKKPLKLVVNSTGVRIFDGQREVRKIAWKSMHLIEVHSRTFSIVLNTDKKDISNRLEFKFDDKRMAEECYDTIIGHQQFFDVKKSEVIRRRTPLISNLSPIQPNQRLFRSQVNTPTFNNHQVARNQFASSQQLKF